MTVTTVETPASATNTNAEITQADEDILSGDSSSEQELKLADYFYSCHEGKGESHKHYSKVRVKTRQGCQDRCNADEECKGFDFGFLHQSAREGICRLYKANKPRLGSTGEIKREYCKKYGTDGTGTVEAEKGVRRFEEKYSCQEGSVGDDISFRRSDDASSLEACAALCDAEQECQAIDFSVAKSQLSEHLRQSLMGKRMGSMCRMYKRTTTHLNDAGWGERKYCEKNGDEANHP